MKNVQTISNTNYFENIKINVGVLFSLQILGVLGPHESQSGKNWNTVILKKKC